MTVETKRFISVADIKSVEIECSNCKVRTFYPLDGNKNVPQRCPHCTHDWFSSVVEMDNALRNLRRAVRNFSQDAGKDAGMRLSIEIAPETSEADSEKQESRQG